MHFLDLNINHLSSNSGLLRQTLTLLVPTDIHSPCPDTTIYYKLTLFCLVFHFTHYQTFFDSQVICPIPACLNINPLHPALLWLTAYIFIPICLAIIVFCVSRGFYTDARPKLHSTVPPKKLYTLNFFLILFNFHFCQILA